MSTPRRVLVPICVGTDQLDSTTQFYETLLVTRADPDIDIGSAPITLRTVGSILIVAGAAEATEEVRRLRAIVFVEDLEESIDAALAGGAVIVKEPNGIGGGRLAHLKHPDGSIVEYLSV